MHAVESEADPARISPWLQYQVELQLLLVTVKYNINVRVDSPIGHVPIRGQAELPLPWIVAAHVVHLARQFLARLGRSPPGAGEFHRNDAGFAVRPGKDADSGAAILQGDNISTATGNVPFLARISLPFKGQRQLSIASGNQGSVGWRRNEQRAKTSNEESR